MTSTYRRDHITDNARDEFVRLGATARADIVARVTAFEAAWPAGPAFSAGERLALMRAMARALIDSGKASAAGVV